MEDVWFDINKGTNSKPFWIAASCIRAYEESTRTVRFLTTTTSYNVSFDAGRDIAQYIRDHEYKPGKTADL